MNIPFTLVLEASPSSGTIRTAQCKFKSRIAHKRYFTGNVKDLRD